MSHIGKQVKNKYRKSTEQVPNTFRNIQKRFRASSNKFRTSSEPAPKQFQSSSDQVPTKFLKRVRQSSQTAPKQFRETKHETDPSTFRTSLETRNSFEQLPKLSKHVPTKFRNRSEQHRKKVPKTVRQTGTQARTGRQRDDRQADRQREYS